MFWKLSKVIEVHRVEMMEPVFLAVSDDNRDGGVINKC